MFSMALAVSWSTPEQNRIHTYEIKLVDGKTEAYLTKHKLALKNCKIKNKQKCNLRFHTHKHESKPKVATITGMKKKK